MSMDPNPTSGEMLALAMDMTSHAATGRRHQAHETGMRLLASLPRLTGMRENLTVKLSTTPAGDLKISLYTEGRYCSHEISRRPSWPQIEKLYVAIEESMKTHVVIARAKKHHEATGIDPVWSYRGDMLLKGMIRASDMTAQEYHDWVASDRRSQSYAQALSVGQQPVSPLLKHGGNMLDGRPGLPVHQIRPRLVARRYDLDYYCLSADVWWTNGLPGNRTGFVLVGRTLPETVRQAMVERAVGEIIGHDAIDDDRYRIIAVQRRGRSMVLRVDPVSDWLDEHPADVKETLDGIGRGIQMMIDHHRPVWARNAE